MGSSKKVTVGYRYYMGLQFGLCHGPVDALHEVVVGDRSAWAGTQAASGSLAINAPELFGGDKREGGISGQLDVQMGGMAQTENSYLVSKLGAAIPAFRGILSAVWRGGQVSANNPYVKPWSFRVKRILQGWTGGSAWYPEKAPIPGAVISVGSDYEGNFSHPEATLVWVGQGIPQPTLGEITGTADEIGQLLVDMRNQAFEDYYGPAGDPVEWNPVVFDYAYYTDNTDTLTAVGHVPPLPIQIGLAEVGSIYPNCPIGGTLSWNQATQVVTCSSAPTYHTDMNPAHIVYQCLTDTAWGMGYPTSAIDNTSFTAAADALYAEGFGLSLLWNRQETIEAFVQVVLDHIGGMLYVKPDTGAFALKLIRDDYVRESLPQYGPTNLVRADEYQRQAWGETINEITVVYTNHTTSKEVSTTVQDTANIMTQSGVVSQVRNYPGISNASLAQRVALRDLNAASTPLAKIRLTATRAAWAVFPGDVFRLTWPDYDIADVVYRVLAVNRGTLQDGQIIIDAVEDVFGLPDNTYLVDQGGLWEDPSNEPAPVPYRALLETPYWDLVRNLSAADMDYVDSLSGYLETLAVRSSNDAVNYTICTRVGVADYAERGNGDFCPSATIVEALTKTTTAITLNSGVDLDLVVAGGYAVVGGEYVLISAIDAVALTATISRGVLDTVPAAHVASSRIWFADGYQGFEQTEYADAETVDVKLLPVTGRGELPLADAPADSLTFDQRQYRPYPPGKIRFDTLEWPATIEGSADVVLTWAHRDRLSQTAYIVDQDEASIGPEASVTYSLEVADEALAVLHSATGITAATATVPASSLVPGLLRFRLWAVRGGLTSWQTHEHFAIWGDVRATEDGEARITEGGEYRITD